MRLGVAVVLSLLACAHTAFADAPWAQGVSTADQERATALAAEGSTLVTQSPAAALDKYEAAIEIWNSPVFQFRRTITLMQLGRDDDARAAMAVALQYGKAPFSDDEYQQALSYKAILDDKASKAVALQYERRWPRWIPWTIVGGGALGFAAGLGIWTIASSDMDTYDQHIASACAASGCNLTNPQTPSEKALAEELAAEHDRAQSRMTVAHVTVAVGAAALATGIVLAVLNRPRAVRVDAHATAGGATASLGWDF